MPETQKSSTIRPIFVALLVSICFYISCFAFLLTVMSDQNFGSMIFGAYAYLGAVIFGILGALSNVWCLFTGVTTSQFTALCISTVIMVCFVLFAVMSFLINGAITI